MEAIMTSTESTPSSQKLTREFVASLEPQVRMVDSDGDVQLYCYTTCSESDPEHIKACRGIVFEGDTIVLKPFPYTPEYTVHDADTIAASVPHLSQCKVFESYEGVVIRCFHAANKWFVSTHRRLDASRSKWSSRVSFGDTFALSVQHYYADLFADKDGDTPMDKFFAFLDTSRQYVFLLEHDTDNRIVCAPRDVPLVYHLGTYIDNEFDTETSIGMQQPRQVHPATFDDLMEAVEQVQPFEMQGYVVFTPTGQIKLLNSQYKYLFDLRGNEPSIKFRYLQIRMDYQRNQDFCTIYDTHRDTFMAYENAIYEIALRIKNAYIKRFIKKEFVTMPPEEYSIIKLCHGWHIEDRDNHHISFEKVMSIMNDQPPTKLNRMIRRYLNEEKLKTEPEQSK